MAFRALPVSYDATRSNRASLRPSVVYSYDLKNRLTRDKNDASFLICAFARYSSARACRARSSTPCSAFMRCRSQSARSAASSVLGTGRRSVRTGVRSNWLRILRPQLKRNVVVSKIGAAFGRAALLTTARTARQKLDVARFDFGRIFRRAILVFPRPGL